MLPTERWRAWSGGTPIDADVSPFDVDDGMDLDDVDVVLKLNADVVPCDGTFACIALRGLGDPNEESSLDPPWRGDTTTPPTEEDKLPLDEGEKPKLEKSILF